MSDRDLQRSRGKPTIVQLYNLSQDIGEQHDLADERPEIVERMTAQLQQLIEKGSSRADLASRNDTPVRFDTIQMQRWGPPLE